MARKSMIHTKQQEDKVAENASNKRKWKGNHNGGSSQQNKGHKVPRTHITLPINKKAYAGSLPLCNQCKFHHNGPCIIKCGNCKKAENKRKLDNNSKNNQNQQQPNKRQNIGRAYAARHREKKHYGGSKPLCSKCNYHYDGSCAPKCHECNRVGHLARDYRSSTNANTTNNQRGIRASQKATCYECGNQGHYRRDCPEQKNQKHENQIGGAGARGVVRALRGGETDQDLNNIKDKIEA
ncbi:putative reverse transcriptase domain-containing protein [Tanacetum coccineum]